MVQIDNLADQVLHVLIYEPTSHLLLREWDIPPLSQLVMDDDLEVVPAGEYVRLS